MCLILIPTSSLSKEIILTCVVIISLFLDMPMSVSFPTAAIICYGTLRNRSLPLTVLESSLKSKCWQGWFLPKAPRENSLYPLLASGGCWQSLEFLGLELPSHPCLCVHMGFPSLSMCLKSPSPLIRTLVIDLDLQAQDDLMPTFLT